MGVALAFGLAMVLSGCGQNYYDAHPEARSGYKKTSSSLKPNVKPTAPRKAVSKNRSKPSVVTVRKGETLYALSRAYHVPVQDIINENRLRAPYTLAIGQELRLPTSRHHIVKRGETGSAIARAYGVNVSDLMQQNKIRSPYILRVGQKLALPGGAKRQAVVNVRPASQTTQPARSGTVIGNKVYKAPPRTSSRFSWPLNGRVLSSYGVKPNMQRNEGINIAARRGASVRSAEAGVVVFASDALASYGNMLLIKHADGWLTAYAHNDELLVGQGQNVKKGQVIAKVGSTGGVKTPQLHFEVRKGRTTYDPLRYLTKQSASTSH